MVDAPFGMWIDPVDGLREHNFAITVVGVPTTDLIKVTIHSVKAGLLGRDDDPKLATIYGDDTVEVTGATIVRGLGISEEIDTQVWIYARARLGMYGIDKLRADKYTASVPVMIVADPTVIPPNGGNGGCIEGTITADGRMICQNGAWIPYDPGNGNGNGSTQPYLTYEQALARLNQGLPCYIKCILPVLNMLPGIPYALWMPLLPGFVITEMM